MILFILGFISAYILEAVMLWWIWKYSEREEKRETLDPRFGRERFEGNGI